MPALRTASGAFVATDYNQDIIWADGYFVKYSVASVRSTKIPFPPAQMSCMLPPTFSRFGEKGHENKAPCFVSRDDLAIEFSAMPDASSRGQRRCRLPARSDRRVVSSSLRRFAYAAVLGLLVGSYLNVVIFRLPRRISTVLPRSRCPRCRGADPPLGQHPAA